MNLFWMPLNPRRGLIYVLLALAEAAWLASALRYGLNLLLTDPSGWFLTLLAMIGLAVLLGWLADVYNAPFELLRGASLILAGLSGLILFKATLLPERSVWQLAWLVDLVRGLFAAPADGVALVCVTAYIWWRGLIIGHTPPEPFLPRFTLRVGGSAFLAMMTLGSFFPARLPSLFFLLVFAVSGLLAMVLSYTQLVAEHHGERAAGGLKKPLLTGALVALMVLALALALGTLFSLPVLEKFFGWLGLILGYLLKPFGVLFVHLIMALQPFLAWVVETLRALMATDGALIGPVPEPSATAIPPEPGVDGQSRPDLWVTLWQWGWRGLVVLLVGWGFYKISGLLNRRYQVRSLLPDSVGTTRETVAPAMPDAGHWLERGKEKLLALARKLARGDDLRAAASIRRIYAALMVLAQENQLERRADQTPLEFLQPLIVAWPELAEPFTTITTAYINVHYGQYIEGKAGLEKVRRAWEQVYTVLQTERG